MVQIGERIQRRRRECSLTQADVAEALGVSRAAIAQWEKGVTTPSFEKVTNMAQLMNTTPEWLGFGIEQDTSPTEVIDDQAQISIPEVSYDTSGVETSALRSWYLPADFLRERFGLIQCDQLRVLSAGTSDHAPKINRGDRLLVDTGQQRISADGYFLIWSGTAANLVHLSVRLSAGKPLVRVRTGVAESLSYETELEDLRVLGRVLMVLWGEI